MTDKIKDNEQVYDDEIAPALQKVNAICLKHKIPFVAAIEWNVGERARTVCRVPGQDLAMTMLEHCAKTGTNIDGYIIGLLRYCDSKGIDTSSSIVMQKMKGKL